MAGSLRRVLSAAAVLAVPLLALAGCSAGDGQAAAQPAASSHPSAGAQGRAVSVVDGTGAKVSLSRPATRVVALDPSSIEVLHDLGVPHIAYDSSEPLFVKSLFGRTTGGGLTQIGGTWSKPDVEGIIAFRPDLVVGDAYPHAEIKPALKGVAPMYLVTRSGGYRQAMKDFRNLGILAGRQAVADKDVASFTADLARARGASPDDQTSLIIWGQSASSFQVPTVDDPSASVLAQVSKYPWGGSGAQGMSLSLEDILKVNPDVIFVESLARLANPHAPSLSSQMAADPLWRQLKAVKDHRVYDVDPDVWHDDRGGLGLKEILDQAMPLLYPHTKR
ncbi:MAG TPA: ABC transporter substrate-binding protein [Microbacteriaceae bacterium]|nr:ABC transporter substrate-binding protein [Microbacteriaceae bacterium]